MSYIKPWVLIYLSKIEVTVPETLPENAVEDEEFLKSLHNVISDIHIIEAELSCENCGRVYKISEGIPNMVSPLHDNSITLLTQYPVA